MTESQQQPHRGPWLKALFLSLAVLLVALSAATGISCLRFMTAWRDVTPERLLEQAQQEPDLEAILAQDREVVEALKQKNFYAPPAPERNPVTQVNAIVGGEALINGDWHKAGDSIGEAKLLEVWPTYVVIEWKGDQKNLGPISAPDSGAGDGPRPGSRPGSEGAVVVNQAVTEGPPPGMMPPSPEEIEMLKAMSPEERATFMRARMQQ